MSKEQRAVRGGGLVEVAALLSLSPSRAAEADSGRLCETTGVGIGATANILAQPTASSVQQHMAKLWVLWHCWVGIEEVATRGYRLTTAASPKQCCAT